MDHNSWDQLGLYGEEDDVVIAIHYKDLLQRNDFDTKEVKDKWLSLKLHTSNKRAMETLTKQAFWKQIYTLHSDQFSQVLMLVEISLTMAVSSSCCEGGFSCMSRLTLSHHMPVFRLKKKVSLTLRPRNPAKKTWQTTRHHNEADFVGGGSFY